MSLDHDSGVLDGTVLEGKFKGKRLGELDQKELADLLEQCRIEDEESSQILEAYLDRIFGVDWRNDHASWGHKNKKGSSQKGPSTSENKMTREEAYDVLNISPGASTKETVSYTHLTLPTKA